MPGGRTEAEQLSVYLAYRSLTGTGTPPRASLGGKLLLLSDPEWALAASITGGASLVAMPETAPAKAALRAGCCNFLVSDLDEAVRILKNEIRRGAAISVGLLCSLSDVERACVERGLQPDLLERAQWALESRGARVVPWQGALPTGESLVTWSAHGSGVSALRAVSALVRQCIESNDAARQQWLAQAPAVLGRQPQQSVAMSPGETERLLAALDGEPGALACAVSVAGRQVWPRLPGESGG